MNKIVIQTLSRTNLHKFEIDKVEGEFQGFPDILSISNVVAIGNSKFENNALFLNLKIDADIIMLDSYTAYDVETHLSFDLDIIFSNDERADYPLDNVIEIDPIIIGNILAETPYTISKD